MAAFAERFGHIFVAHAVGDVNRSAGVERMFRAVERSFLPGRRFTDWADANRQARAWCDRVNARPKRRLHATPRELFAVEHAAMRRLPRWVPEPYLLHERLVDVEGYVTLHTNRYSVPADLIGRRVEVRESIDRVVIYHGPREITGHPRELEPLSRYVFRPEHRPPRGHGRRREPFPEEQALLCLLPESQDYLAALKRRGKLQTTLALRQLVRMAREYPRAPLRSALQTAAHYGLYDLGRLERMVLRAIATDYFQLPLDPDPTPGGPDDEPTDGRTPTAPEEPPLEPDGRGPA